MRKQMNRIKTICKLNTDKRWRLPHFIANSLSILCIIICLTTVPVWAEETPDSEQKDGETVTQTEENSETQSEVTEDEKTTKTSDSENTQTEPTKEVIIGDSDFMDRDQKKGITILTGNVKTVRQNEAGEEIGFLNADKVTLINDTKTGETIEIIAEGNVEIRDQNIFATCDHATMNNKTNIIVLKENVVVLQKEDRLETKLFTFNRTTGKQTGVGDVKFKVTVTQATPTETTEESEDPSTEGTEDSSSTTDKESVSTDSEKESEKKPNSENGEGDKEEKSNPTNTEKDEKESEKESDTESDETEDETETTETEDETEDETEATETEEENETTEPDETEDETETEEESEDTEEPEEKE